MPRPCCTAGRPISTPSTPGPTCNRTLRRISPETGISAAICLHGSFATEDGGLIFQSYSPLVKIDACSRLVWINDEDLFDHSIERDDSGMFWIETDQEPVTIKGGPQGVP